MAQVLRRYAMLSRWYAQVLGDDGEQRELKIVSEVEPTDVEFLVLSADVEAIMAELNESPFLVEAEDGTTVG